MFDSLVGHLKRSWFIGNIPCMAIGAVSRNNNSRALIFPFHVKVSSFSCFSLVNESRYSGFLETLNKNAKVNNNLQSGMRGQNYNKPMR
jgi:hypothetical protein